MNALTKVLSLGTVVLTMASCSKKQEQVPYTVVENYSVRNTLEVPEMIQTIIDTQEDFDSYFDKAATKGENGNPTPVDFEKQIVLSVIMPETNKTAEITPVSLEKGEGGLQFYYKIEQSKDTTTYNTIPCLLVAVERENASRVILISEKTK